MRKRDARNEQAAIIMGAAPALDDRTVSDLRELASDLEIEVEAEEGSSEKPVKDDLLRDISEALDSIDPYATDLLRAGVLDEQMPDEITEAVLDAVPDSSFEPSWVKAYLNEWARNETGWWEENGEWIKEEYLPLLEADDEEADDEEEGEGEEEQQAA